MAGRAIALGLLGVALSSAAVGAGCSAHKGWASSDGAGGSNVLTGAGGDNVGAGPGSTSSATGGPSSSASSTSTSSGAGGASTSSGAGGAGGMEVLPPMKTQSFLIGYNEAWFGQNFGTDLTSSFDLGYVQQTFDQIVASGGHLVRIWVFEAPQGITLGASPPQTGAVSNELLTNLDTVIHEARKRALWVYVGLLDANTATKVQGQLHDYYQNLFTNTSGELDAYHQNALAPVLTVLDKHQDNVFGIDMVNEIEAAISRGTFSDPVNGPRALMKATRDFIKSKSPWVKVTSTTGWDGSQYDITNGLFSGLGLDFYDLHVYADDGTFPGATALCQKVAQDGVPIYLGEFGQHSMGSADDTLQYNVTADFLNNVKALCFKGAFAWRFDPSDTVLGYMRPGWQPRPAVQIMQVFGAQP